MTAPVATRLDVLPRSLPPRGINRAEAAKYVGVSPTKFDELIKDGLMPRAKPIGGRKVWDVRKLDAAFDALPDSDEGNPWDDIEFS